MAVTDTPFILTYDGNGSTMWPYQVTFSYTDATDIKMLVNDVAYTTFTVSLDGVRTQTAVAPGTPVIIYRDTAVTQDINYPANTTPASTSVGTSVDKLARTQQEQKAVPIRLPAGESFNALPSKATMKSKYVYVDASGDPVDRSAAQMAADVESELGISAGAVADAGTQRFADSDARIIAVPDREGQLGVQLDDSSTWVSTGLLAGNWTADSDLSCADGAARILLVPTAIGVTLLQLDDLSKWVSTGTSAGNWLPEIRHNLKESDWHPVGNEGVEPSAAIRPLLNKINGNKIIVDYPQNITAAGLTHDEVLAAAVLYLDRGVNADAAGVGSRRHHQAG